MVICFRLLYNKEYQSQTFFEGDIEMNTEFTAVTKQDGGWWIGWIVEVPGVNCQERTHEELLDSLRVTLQEAIEFNREEALKAAGENYREEKIAV
jgi:predicted RNase H-like HicB family nuclease